MALLVQFLLRLGYGLSLGMLLAPAKDVPSGYFRNHLYVVLGVTALAALLSRTAAADAFPWAVAAAIVAYGGAVCWLYESAASGKAALAVAALLGLGGAWQALPATRASSAERTATAPAAAPSQQAFAPAASAPPLALRRLQAATSGALLGVTLAAMLLGHWYLNAPGMRLAALDRLLAAVFAAVALQATVSAAGWGLTLRAGAGERDLAWHMLLAMRWLFGLAGVFVLAWMARQTLRIPNTQSATGILYVAVIGVFVGEIAGMLLSVSNPFPV